MEFRFIININNAAFGDSPSGEIARLLHEAAADLESNGTDHLIDDLQHVHDLNGNFVGTCGIQQEEN